MVKNEKNCTIKKIYKATYRKKQWRKRKTGMGFSVLVSFELYVYWILVCVCDSNLRKFLVEILDTVSLDKLDYDLCRYKDS